MTMNLLLGAHIITGTVALIVFWLAATMKKGTPAHRLIGRCYLITMVLVLLTAVPLAVQMLVAGRPVIATFLAYLVLITAGACWHAWRAIRDRQHHERYFGASYGLSAVLIAVAGAVVMVTGIRTGSTLLIVFGAIGVFGLFDAVLRYRRAPDDPRWWLREHYGAIIGNGIAVHIAFFGIGLRHAFPGIDPALLQSLSWFGPLLVAVVVASRQNRRYRKPMIAPAQPVRQVPVGR